MEMELLKNWTLKLNGRRRAFNVYTPSFWDRSMAFEHILDKYQPTAAYDTWPEGDPKIEMSFEYVLATDAHAKKKLQETLQYVEDQLKNQKRPVYIIRADKSVELKRAY